MILNLSPQIVLVFNLILNKKVVSGIILSIILNAKNAYPKYTLNH